MKDILNIPNKELPQLGLSKLEEKYFYNLKFLHVYVGLLERNPPLENDDIFQPYLPLNLPKALIDYYLQNVTITKDKGLCLFANSYNRIKVKWYDNPVKNRVNSLYGFQLARYFKNPNWNYKLSFIFNSTGDSSSYSLCGKLVNSSVLVALYNKTGCATHCSGVIVNPNAPYLSFVPTGVTYCKGHEWLVSTKTPLNGRTKPINVTMSQLSYIRKKNNTYELKKQNSIYGEIQLGLAIMKLKKAIFIINNVFDSQIYIFYIDFDKAYIRETLNNLYSVYFSKFLPRLYKTSFHLL